MDIGSLNTAAYTDMLRSQASSTGKLDSTLKKEDYSKAEEKELMDVCKQFEAYFLEQVFKSMEKTVLKDESSSTTYTTSMLDYFGDSARQEIASQATEGQGLGLAQTLFEQMKRNYNL